MRRLCIWQQALGWTASTKSPDINHPLTLPPNSPRPAKTAPRRRMQGYRPQPHPQARPVVGYGGYRPQPRPQYAPQQHHHHHHHGNRVNMAQQNMRVSNNNNNNNNHHMDNRRYYTAAGGAAAGAVAIAGASAYAGASSSDADWCDDCFPIPKRDIAACSKAALKALAVRVAVG
ncbi:hypothetical protein MKZ38_001173 [Zalerion maritima]|uniref:Uncharacterized protein n=1 Tax=Zalerion maritima TaxID=339359 RepID=A0AAD5RZ75_9PEZI|nr:hypothetical protein MKZ38_001173 [Zalerion maritima]